MIDIHLKNLTKIYEGGADAPAVDNVSLSVNKGELFFLLGPSGCGKTTLLRMIAGLVLPTSGQILFGDRDVANLPPEKRDTALVFQNYALWPHMTVRENVLFGPKRKHLPRTERERVATENLQLVQMLDYAKRKPNQLSGGQQQRVALARALAAQPKCLLLDEPLSNLDARLRMHMRGELRRLIKDTRSTGVYVTHDQTEAMSMADRIAVMHRGKVVQVGSPEQLYHRPATRFVADFLGEANFLKGTLEQAGTVAKVKTSAGTLVAAGASADLSAGAEVTCCVRPERLMLLNDASAPAGQTALPATVDQRVFLGEMVEYRCTLESGQPWKVFALSGQAQAREGQNVSLLVPAEDVVLLTE
ncbi:MAG: ABC transporter ATP-binding protein [Phycisphaerae bacterium]